MSAEPSPTGPLQLLLIGFETTDRMRGEAARELLALRGRGMIRVLDARMFSRAPDGTLTQVDLGTLLADRPELESNPIAHLLGVNGSAGNGSSGTPDAFARTAGFAVEDVRRLTDEIGPGDHAVAVLVEHVWAARLREAVRDAGGRLVGQGFLTPELMMIVGAEIQAHADAQAALELADAAQGAALLDALSVLAPGRQSSPEERARGAAEVVRVLVREGYVHPADASPAINALATAGLIQLAAVQAAAAEAEEFLRRRGVTS